MSEAASVDADESERRRQVKYLDKRLKIPRREADRLLANTEARADR